MSQPDGPPPTADFPASGPGPAAPAGRRRDMTGVTLGDFRIGRPLGRGGMGEVFAAHQISLNREVALKILRADLLANPIFLSRFETEAHAAAKLNHPHIVHIYALGCVDGVRFIAMEYVAGTNLREYLLRKGPPDLPLALSIMRQSGAAVGAAGEVGLIHRDIKPENLLLNRKGQVKVADFGLCRNLDEDLHVTQPGVTLGTPLYMSPEQARGKTLDHRSDLYSLGVTFYHMLSGSPPFRAESALAIAMKHVSDTPVHLSVHRPDLPADLCRLVMKLMSKDPADRFQSAGEMLRDLTRIRETLAVASMAAVTPVASPVVGPAAPSSPSASTPSGVVPEAPSGAGPGPARPRFAWPGRRALVVASALGLLAGVGAGWLARPGDLLSAEVGGRRLRAPAAWLAPEWGQVPRQADPAAQYRFAQLLAPAGSRMAAWVAVSGYFPGDQGWAFRSYGQIARELFRARDRDRLAAFASVLAKAPDRVHGGEDESLAWLMRVGVSALDGDAAKVLGDFSADAYGPINGLLDPALADFALEIVLRLEGDAGRLELTRTVSDRLRDVQLRLARRLVEIKKKDFQG